MGEPNARGGKRPVKTLRMEEMTWPEIRAAIDRGFTTVVFARDG
jgi:hypothetical protein